MKKLKKYLSISFLSLLIVSMIILPIETNAKTIKEFQQEVDKYTKELEDRKAKIATNEAEIAKIKQRISEIEKEIAKAEEEIAQLQKEIDESNAEIKRKSEESKSIMEYYQVSNGENVYLEYAFGAKSITDMIYRLSIVEQLTEYNNKVMKELEELIKKNEEQKKKLQEKEDELKKLKKNLEEEQSRIALDIASIKAGMPSIEEQIKAAKSQLANAKSLGCGETEDINSCIYRVSQKNKSNGGTSIPSTNGFYRPIEYGYVTQYYSGCGTYIEWKGVCSGHIGIDISSSNKSIPVYPIASGYVTATYYDPAGALVVKVKHNYNGRYIYSTYAHLRSFSVSKGQFVTHNTQLGLMGSTGNSTGPHLHMEITTCDWASDFGGCTWRNYAISSSRNPRDYVAFPASWSNR